tara:strand:- start:3609 stop:4676 length:1068 start_codon:yes stop_codon:yes gene_type:complete
VKITSLFKDKAYAFTHAGDPQEDCAFGTKVLEKIKPSFEVSDILLQQVKDHCDVFLIQTSNSGLLKLKTSLSDPHKLLKKEATALRSGEGFSGFPKLIAEGSTQVGEPIDYLLMRVPPAESLREHGRSGIIERIDPFLKHYWNFTQTRPVKQTYKQVLDRFADELIPANSLPEESLEAVKTYTDYSLCENILLTLHSELLDCFEKAKEELKYKCHGSLSLDAIFLGGSHIYFDDLYNVCMGHPFLDFMDLSFELGIPKEEEMSFFSKFCKAGDFIPNRNLYYTLYDLQLRKKLTDLLTSYIREVYLYDSFRYEKILFIADTFAHCYEKFCQIDLFKENRKFIMKTICEPIFGVKA